MTDEDDEFERIERENAMKGQPYYFQEHPTDPKKVIFRKPYRKLDDDDIQDYVRPWVGLTDEERDYFTYIDAKDKARFRKYFDYVEAKLKEKNT